MTNIALYKSLREAKPTSGQVSEEVATEAVRENDSIPKQLDEFANKFTRLLDRLENKVNMLIYLNLAMIAAMLGLLLRSLI